MKLNIGLFDRKVRITLGVLILLAHYIYYFATGYYCIYANIGWLLLLTGLIRRCPLYLPFRINTNKE